MDSVTQFPFYSHKVVQDSAPETRPQGARQGVGTQDIIVVIGGQI